MINNVKVGDTFRVFEVVKPLFETLNKHLIGKQTIERQYYFKSIDLVCLEIDKSLWNLDELKQVGTIRIKSLKNKM